MVRLYCRANCCAAKYTKKRADSSYIRQCFSVLDGLLTKGQFGSVTLRAATQTTHLGRYHVVKRLAAGGMADVLLARTDGIAGFERHVVIKRIHPDLLDEPRYVKMFLDEARLAASLHHHNIVQVNDIGEQGGEYFFAMEYVHGEDVRTLLVGASQRGEQIPLEHVVTIIMAAASGLHHAHERRGIDGAPLHIVHRDVSPANILVGYDGAVKVADFGIALAAHRAEQTQSGVLKGKVAYMSPEQCNCEPVDRRSDVFSLGIVLYELVTVRPCFAGDNDFMTMSGIVGGRVEPPSTFRKDLPPALEAIMMKALALDPAQRYQSADDLRVALEEYATATGMRTSATALADYMKLQFGAKALPWQEDDDNEPEIEMLPEGQTRDRVMALPPRQLTPSPNVQRRADIHSERRDRTPPRPTVPMRPVGDDLAIPQASDDDLAIPVVARSPITGPVQPAAVRSPTLPLHALSTRAPGHVVVGTPAVARARTDRLASGRRLWLAGSVAAVAIAAASLFLVRSGPGTASPRASTAPAAVHPRATAPQPLERPRVRRVAPAARIKAVAEPVAETAVEVGEAAAAEPAAPAAKKSRRPAKKEARSARTKKWDPDALFPQ